MAVRAIRTLWREEGAAGCARAISAAVRMTVPLLLRGRRTAAGTGAYFDLVTADSRRFYGDNFHFGYFQTGTETLQEAHDAHTDLVAELAQLGPGQRVLDVGCGLGAPAIRMARRHGCEIVGLNISREQVRQGRELIAREGMEGKVAIEHGDAREMPFADGRFDAVVCVEVAGDICVTEADKQQLVGEISRVLRPGGQIGFSDLALLSAPSKEERRALRSVFYDDGSALVTDWPEIFAANQLTVSGYRSIIAQTMPTWDRIADIYTGRDSELERRYGKLIARRTCAQIARITEILTRLGTFPVLAAHKQEEDEPLSTLAEGTVA